MVKIFSVWRIGHAFVKANVISNQYLCQIFIMALTLQDIRNALFSIINFLYFIVYCRITHNFCLQYRHLFTEFLIFLCLTNWVLTISDIYIKFLSFLVICHFICNMCIYWTCIYRPVCIEFFIFYVWLSFGPVEFDSSVTIMIFVLILLLS